MTALAKSPVNGIDDVTTHHRHLIQDDGVHILHDGYLVAVHLSVAERSLHGEVEAEERVDRLASCVDGSDARRGKNDELLADVLADVLEECGLAGTRPSGKEEALIGSCDEVVCILHLLVCGVENLCLFHVMFVLAFILVTLRLLLSMTD